jgi:hypothetical protein
MNPMNTQTNKPTKRIPHVRVLFTLATLCLIQSLIANVAFAQVKYSTFSRPDVTGTTGVSGIRGAGGQDVLITAGFHPNPTPTPTCSPGASPSSHGLLYVGPLSGGGNSGSWTVLDYPSSPGITVTGTILYGPDNLPPSNVRLVGSYTKCEDPDVRDHGALYQGPPDGSCNNCWQTIDFPISAVTPSPSPGEQIHNTIAHSNMGGLVVGNFDTDLVTGKAFVYDIAANSWKELKNEDAIPQWISITAYGIWYNGGTSYTIAGGYSETNSGGIDHGYLVNWDSATQTAAGWTKYDFENGQIRVQVSHFDGITTDNQGGYYLAGQYVGDTQPLVGGFFAHVRQMPHRQFGDAHWRQIVFPSSVLTTGDTVFENNVLGVYIPANGTPTSYLATVQGHR